MSRAKPECLDVHVQCPPMETDHGTNLDIFDQMRAVDARYLAADQPPIRLERSLAKALEATERTSSHRLPSTPYRRFEQRPSAEPVLREAWDRLVREPMTDAFADQIVSAMTGHPHRRRTGMISTVRNAAGRRIVYARPEIASEWSLRVDEAETRTGLQPLALACHSYAEVALSHPYVDGNGRLARTMFQRALARVHLLHGPILPLGPLIYANHSAVTAALTTLGTTGAWAPLIDVMARLTRKALAFTDHMLREMPPRVEGC